MGLRLGGRDSVKCAAVALHLRKSARDRSRRGIDSRVGGPIGVVAVAGATVFAACSLVELSNLNPIKQPFSRQPSGSILDQLAIQ